MVDAVARVCVHDLEMDGAVQDVVCGRFDATLRFTRKDPYASHITSLT
jgi:hypothetical protein